MTTQNRLAALEKRRDNLKREIEECEAHPSVDQLKIAELKRIKLQIKDEIARLSSSVPATHSQAARV